MSKARSGGRSSSSRSSSQKSKFSSSGRSSGDKSTSSFDKKKGAGKSSDKYVRKDSDKEFSKDNKFARKLGDRNHSGVKKEFKSFDSKDKFKGKDDRSDKKFSRDEKPFKKKFGDDKFEKKKFGDDKPFKKKFGDDGDKPRFKSGDKPYKKKFGVDGDKPRFKKEDGSFTKKKFGSASGVKFGDEKPSFKKKNDDSDEKPRFKKEGSFSKNKFGGDKFEKKFEGASKDFSESKSFKKSFSDDDSDSKSFGKNDRYKSKEKFGDKRAYKMVDPKTENDFDFSLKDHESSKKSLEKGKNEYNRLLRKSEKNIGKKEKVDDDGTIRLNRYISNSGVCSRRDADNLILAGAVMVNGKVVTALGTKVKSTDKIQYGGQTIKSEKNVYIVLNKPKDYITTMDDPQGRKTVMSLLRGACKERIYPVGRLDRNTTGILLFTNDGELTRRLTHPKFLVSKMYHVEVDQNFKREDLAKMRNGFELEDGFIKPDQLEFTGDEKRELGIEVHSGRNRIVRRMFEHFGYNVTKLDRVMFAGLSKKDTPRGKWRMLTEKEVGFLKML
jgi:23S rRNA pseudouridine2605 synthase